MKRPLILLLAAGLSWSLLPGVAMAGFDQKQVFGSGDPEIVTVTWTGNIVCGIGEKPQVRVLAKWTEEPLDNAPDWVGTIEASGKTYQGEDSWSKNKGVVGQELGTFEHPIGKWFRWRDHTFGTWFIVTGPSSGTLNSATLTLSMSGDGAGAIGRAISRAQVGCKT